MASIAHHALAARPMKRYLDQVRLRTHLEFVERLAKVSCHGTLAPC